MMMRSTVALLLSLIQMMALRMVHGQDILYRGYVVSRFQGREYCLSADQTVGGSQSPVGDYRDPYSTYVHTHSDCDNRITFNAIAVPDSGGYHLQVDAIGTTVGTIYRGRYLGVSDLLPDDGVYPGFLRLNMHADVADAAIWRDEDLRGQKVLQIIENPTMPGGETNGWTMAVPPNSQRNEDSYFMALSPTAVMLLTLEFE